MSAHGRLIFAKYKPRILRHDRMWICVGLRRARWWWQSDSVVMRYGLSPQNAFSTWKLATQYKSLSACSYNVKSDRIT